MNKKNILKKLSVILNSYLINNQYKFTIFLKKVKLALKTNLNGVSHHSGQKK